jgi:hypothetical protein
MRLAPFMSISFLNLIYRGIIFRLLRDPHTAVATNSCLFFIFIEKRAEFVFLALQSNCCEIRDILTRKSTEKVWTKAKS